MKWIFGSNCIRVWNYRKHEKINFWKKCQILYFIRIVKMPIRRGIGIRIGVTYTHINKVCLKFCRLDTKYLRKFVQKNADRNQLNAKHKKIKYITRFQWFWFKNPFWLTNKCSLIFGFRIITENLIFDVKHKNLLFSSQYLEWNTNKIQMKYN